MVCAGDHDAQPSIRRQSIVNRLDVGHDLTADGIGRIAVVAQEEHERLMKALPHDAAEWLTVHVDARLAAGIVVAELKGGGPAERVAEDAHPRQVEPSREPAVQPLQPVEYE